MSSQPIKPTWESYFVHTRPYSLDSGIHSFIYLSQGAGQRQHDSLRVDVTEWAGRPVCSTSTLCQPQKTRSTAAVGFVVVCFIAITFIEEFNSSAWLLFPDDSSFPGNIPPNTFCRRTSLPRQTNAMPWWKPNAIRRRPVRQQQHFRWLHYVISDKTNELVCRWFIICMCIYLPRKFLSEILFIISLQNTR